MIHPLIRDDGDVILNYFGEFKHYIETKICIIESFAF